MLTFVFLDSGQGDSTLVVYPDGSLTWVDCGASKNGTVVAGEIATVIARYLPNSPGGAIQNLILTHADKDHYNLVVRVLNLLGNPPVNQIYYGCTLDLYRNQMENNATYNFLNAYPPASCGPPPQVFGGNAPNPLLSRAGVDVYIMAANCKGWPGAQQYKNANSIVTLFVYNGVKTWLMADSTEETEAFILQQCANQNLNVLLTNDTYSILKMGHHGSESSSGRPWIEAIRPNALVVSSDTLAFGGQGDGTGMPTDTHLAEVIAWSGRIINLPRSLCHTYVYFHREGVHQGHYYESAPTLQAVCTTLYELNYNVTGTAFEPVGGSWYVEVNQDTSLTFGFTGPERNDC